MAMKKKQKEMQEEILIQNIKIQENANLQDESLKSKIVYLESELSKKEKLFNKQQANSVPLPEYNKVLDHNKNLMDSNEALKIRLSDEGKQIQIKVLEVNRLKQEAEFLKGNQKQYLQLQLEVEMKKKELEQKLKEFDKIREENINLKLNQENCHSQFVKAAYDQTKKNDQSTEMNPPSKNNTSSFTRSFKDKSSLHYQTDSNRNSFKSDEVTQIQLQQSQKQKNQTKLNQQEQEQNKIDEDDTVLDNDLDTLYKENQIMRRENAALKNQNALLSQQLKQELNGKVQLLDEENKEELNEYSFTNKNRKKQREDTEEREITDNVSSKNNTSPSLFSDPRRRQQEESHQLNQIEEQKRQIISLNQKIKELQKNSLKLGEFEKMRNEFIILQREKDSQQKFYEQQIRDLRKQISQEIRQTQIFSLELQQLKSSSMSPLIQKKNMN